MKRKAIVFLASLLALATLSFLGYNVISKSKKKIAIAKSLKTIPDFQFQTLDGQIFTNINLLSNNQSVFIYFNSECDFCQHEARDISQNIDKLKDIQFLFISNEPMEAIQEFSQTYNLNNQKNIIVLYDNTNLFSNQFGATSIPYLLIYDTDQKLIKRHKGQMNALGILNLLESKNL